VQLTSPTARRLLGPVLAAAALACGSEPPISPPGPDGWATATPSSQGMNGDLLDEAGDVAADFYSMRGLVVVRHGYIVYERYFRGYDVNDRPVVRGVVGAITSAAYGIALARGDLDSLDLPLADALPQYVAPDDSVRRRITVRHLLTMTSGLDSEQADEAVEDTSWARAWAQAPIVTEPGTTFRYDGALPHLLSAILTARTQTSLAEYMRVRLFQPLGITGTTWDNAPEGLTSGYSGLGIRAREMAKIGQLYLQGGMWNGQQVLPVEWTEQAGMNHAPGGTAAAGYGYLWWISDETGSSAFFGAGYGGQYLYVIPDLDLVVAITGDPDVTPDVPIFHRNLIPDYIAPAVRQ
jgi:CubicO group peptidase (beta-lactamase class C family)